MMKRVFLITVWLTIIFWSCNKSDIVSYQVDSPDKKNSISIYYSHESGYMFYQIHHNGKTVIDTSFIGFRLKNHGFNNKFDILSHESTSADTIWHPIWGQKKSIRDNYQQLTLQCKEKTSGLHITFIARAYNDGIAFRYYFPEQNNLDTLIIIDEKTEFNIAGNPVSWWIPALTPLKYEILYAKSSIDSIPLVHTPFTCCLNDSLFLSIHEAELKNYSSMTLERKKNNALEVNLVPWADGEKVKATVPLYTPWRTIQISETAGGLITSDLILNLNEPNKLTDISWIKPMKYMGIWWGIHINKYSFQQGPKHGATTENTKYYIDFAAKHGFNELLVEGWNIGWEAEWYSSFGKNMNFVEPTPDFDLFEVQKYAQSKGITLQAYVETSANTENFLQQIDTAFALYKSLGYKSVKIGQVGPKFYNGEYHHGQYGVNYYRTIIKKAAEYKLSINFHEPLKPTGERRTYPNMLSREGARGQEYNAAWSRQTNPPSHTCILPFTRLLAGPMDFTPGIFNINGYHEKNQVNTTLAKQLALYVVIYSPVQMAADLPENYEKSLDAFQFIKDVPVDWDTTIVLNAKIGEYVTIVRKDKHSNDWYLGSITNEKPRDFSISLSFLEKNKKYLAEIYSDSHDADWKKNPEAVEIFTKKVDKDMTLPLKLAPGGGEAIRFKLIEGN